MRTKAIKDLGRLNDTENLIINHTFSIESDVQHLAEQKKECGFNILEAILKEEAAKFLILLDAMRCPRVAPDNFSKQLGRFNDHLAKGIYSLVYDFYPGTFGDLQKIIERECHEYYLDGPNGSDWIFKNEILQSREENIYVDYIESDGEHIWLAPRRHYRPEISLFYLRPKVLEVATALWKAGFTKPEALLLLANKWRSIQMSEEFTWLELRGFNIKTLEEMDKNNLLNAQDETVCSTIIDKWLFPLYSLDIRIIRIDREKLKENREKHSFGMYY